MATRFLEQATQQLDPYFQQQTQATQQQLPAIQQLYDTLLQGLEGQRQTETQNILESASQRGVLRSTLPVDLQTQLGAALLGQRGKLESQRAGDIAGVNKSLADIGLTRAQSISQLADALQSRDLQERDFTFKQQQAERQFQLDQQRIQAENAARSANSAAKIPPISQGLAQLFKGYKPAYQGGQPYYTENVIIPQIMDAYNLSEAAAKDVAYKYRKQAFGEGFGS